MSLEAAVHARLADWRDKLIDLSRANRLLNYRPSRAAAIAIVEEDPREIAELILGGRTLHFDAQSEKAKEPKQAESPEPPRQAEQPEQTEPSSESTPPEGAQPAPTLRTGDQRLQTALEAGRLRKVLTRLYRESRASIEEQGFNTLHLALGELRFTTPEDPKGFRAPLLLLPVEVLRRGARADFRLKGYDEEPHVNPALVLKLERDHGIDLALPGEDEPLSYDAVKAAFEPALATLENATLSDALSLGLFSFAKIPLYNDLLQHEEAIGNHLIAAALARGRPLDQGEDAALPLPGDVEARLAEAPAFQILDADSSQQAAILAAREGKSFVLQGPPGTGKSQTIANIIAEALAAERSVLFVSQKMAALEVVERRLAQAGLGAFCLELHSRKANKREVVQSLARAWAQWSEAAGKEAGRQAELTEIQAVLRAYVDALHAERGAAGYSGFEILGHAARYRIVPACPFTLDDPLALDRRRLKDVERRLRALTPLLEAVEPVAEHPWRAAQRSALGVTTLDEVRRTLNLFLADHEESLRAAAEVGTALQQEPPPSRAVTEELVRFARLLERSTRPAPAWIENQDWAGLSPRVKRAVEQGVAYEAARKTLLARYRPSALDLDGADLTRRAQPGGFVFGWFRRRGARKLLAEHIQGSVVDLRSDVDSIVAAQGLRRDVEAADAALLDAFGNEYEGATGHFAPLAAHQAFLEELRSAWPAHVEPAEAIRQTLAGRPPAALATALERWERVSKPAEQRRKELVEVLELDEALAWPAGFEAAPFAVIQETGETWTEHLNALPAWLSWRAGRVQAAGEGLDTYLDAFEAQALRAKHLLDGWFRTWWQACADALLAEVDELKAFDGRAHDGVIARYQELDRDEIEAARRRLAARLRAAVPHPNVRTVGDSEVGVLKREIQKQRRHLPVRVLLDRIPQLVRLLKPCLMMSPLSVATYLPPGKRQFDIVVFDEASQICTEDGVGAIARGKQVVVCGDSKQLPPTRFFERRLEDDDEAPEDVLVDLPSILDECKAGPLPEIPLMWHYRSRDESLIDFSNSHFYEDSLVTFPNAARDAPDLGISFVHVEDGVYHPGPKGSRSNPAEAAAIAERVFAILAERPDDSIGVVTFSTTQRDEVLDAIDARRRDGDPYAERFDGDGDEPVFVKNLEAVQGDERDVILFSVGYGRDPEGALRLNFGPLNKDGGDRRLNVAVTRARKQVAVYSSILPEEIDTSRAKGRGARLLRAYLEIARRGMQGSEIEEEGGDGVERSALVQAIQAEIERLGFDVDVRVGNSAFKVDLALRDPDRPGRYVLAVLVDGPAYAGAATTRDRERTRPEVLTRLGWRVHRIWAPDWVRAPGRELERLASAVDAARTGEPEEAAAPLPEVQAAPADVPAAESAEPATLLDFGLEAEAEPSLPGVVDYRAVNLKLRGPAAEFHVVPLGRLGSALAKVVEVEGPIHVDLATRRLATAWGITRTTSKVTARFEEAAEHLVAEGKATRRGDFLYYPGFDEALVRRPADGVQREIDEIPPEELAACVLLVVDAYLGIASEALVREVGRAFGYQRLGEKIQATLEPVVAALLETGVLVQDDERLRRAPAVADVSEEDAPEQDAAEPPSA